MYCDKSIKEYLNDLAARMPAPGGGSAAALNAAMGAALISMSVNFTLGKPKYIEYEAELKDMLDKSEKLREQFLSMVDSDVVAYASKNIRDALDVPFMLCRLCFESIKLCPPLIKKGNLNLAGDMAVAAVMLESAFVSASFNVDANLKALGDRELARTIKKELIHKERLIRKVRHQMEVKVGKIIRG
jgi:formiminotetrahydrofolate cyclodeaminase